MKRLVIALTAIGLLSFGGVSHAQMWDESADLRRELAIKGFEYEEALRRGDSVQAEAIEKEIAELQGWLGQEAGVVWNKRYRSGRHRGHLLRRHRGYYRSYGPFRGYGYYRYSPFRGYGYYRGYGPYPGYPYRYGPGFYFRYGIGRYGYGCCSGW